MVWRFKQSLMAALLVFAASILASCSTVTGLNDVRAYMTQVETPTGPVKIYVREEGSGPPVLLIHGYGGTTYTWRYLSPALARTHRVYSIDLKGFGKSDKPFDDRYSVFDQADIVMRLIKRKGLRNVTLIGHSFGGGVSLAVAVQMKSAMPGRLKKLVVIDSIAYAQRIPFFMNVLRTPGISHVGVAVIPPEVLTKSALAYAYADDTKIGWDAIFEYSRPLYSIGGKYAAIRTAEQIVPPNIMSYVRRYRTINVPTLIVWCSQDQIVPIINARQLHSDIPFSELRIIRGCGHIPQEEKPRETAQIIGKFLSR